MAYGPLLPTFLRWAPAVLEPFEHAGSLLHFTKSEDDNILLNGSKILHSSQLDFNTTLGALRITPEKVLQWRDRKEKILILGNGMSPLLENLLNNEVDVKALDLWYGLPAHRYPFHSRGREMFRFNRKFAQHLIAGSALSTGLAVDSFDRVLSCMLAPAFDLESQKALLTESLRLLVPGGSAVHGVFSAENAAALLEFLREIYGAKINVALSRHSLIYKSEYTLRAVAEVQGWTLKIIKAPSVSLDYPPLPLPDEAEPRVLPSSPTPPSYPFARPVVLW